VTFVPTGCFAELLAGTPGLEELAAAEGERLCATGAMGLAGYCVAAYETGHAAAGRALEVLRAAVPPSRWVGWGHPLTELLRPAVPPEETRERLRASGRPPEAWLTVRRLRTELAVHALAGDWAALEEAIPQARELAVSASAPSLAWCADWAEAARLGGRDGLERAQAATGRLRDAGERYTAGRLMAELLVRTDAPPALAASTAHELDTMGAHASAALVRDAQAVSR
jgi:hypothetical protein